MIPYKITANLNEGLADCDIAYPIPAPAPTAKRSPSIKAFRRRSCNAAANWIDRRP